MEPVHPNTHLTYLIFALWMAHGPALSALVHNFPELDALVADAARGSLVLRLLDKLMLPVHPGVAEAPHHGVPGGCWDLKMEI